MIRVVLAVQPSGFDYLHSLPLMAVFFFNYVFSQLDKEHWKTQSNILQAKQASLLNTSVFLLTCLVFFDKRSSKT